MTDTKRTITVAASNNLRRLATKPGYISVVEAAANAAAAQGSGPLDNAGGAFPFDVPSEAFEHHLKELDRALDAAQKQIDQLRTLSTTMRAIAAGKAEPEPPAPPMIRDVPARPIIIDGAAVIARIVAEDKREKAPIEIVATAKGPELAALKAEGGNFAAAVTALTWTCPIHDQFAQAVSRKNRPYRYCPVADCGRLDIML